MKLKKITLLTLIFIAILFALSVPSFAASFSASASNQSLNIGESATLTINASDCLGQFSISSSNPGVVSVGNSSVWVENGSQSISVTAVSAGSATITVTAVNVSDSSGDNMVTGSKSVNITVKSPAPVTPSNNGGGTSNPSNPGGNSGNTGNNNNTADPTLKSITVGGKTYNNPGKDFTITVASNVDSVEINAVANKGSVSGTGVKEITTGTNTFKISVTDGGKTATYVVRVRKLADETTTPNITDNKNNSNPNVAQPINEPETNEPVAEVPEEKTEKLGLIYLTVDDVEMSPEFNSEIYEYWVTVTNRNDLSVVAAANDDDAQVEITGNKELKERRK